VPFYDRFVQVMPPDPNVRRLSENELDELRTESMPEALLTLYREVGVGSFGGGLFWLSKPADLQRALDVWLPRSAQRIPFARGAFGDLFYLRDLREEAKALGMTGENPGELGDVSVVQVDDGAISVCALSIEDLCDEILGFDENVNGVFRGDLVRMATEIYGPLAEHEQFGFAPALALGGAEDITCVRKVDLLVHTSILRQTVAR
jgi:hypothetical protein